MTRPPQDALGGKEISPLELQALDEAAARLLGPGGLTPDIAGPVAVLMAAIESTGGIAPDRVIRVLILAAYALGVAAVDAAHPTEALHVSGRIADGLGKALAEVNRFTSENAGGRPA